MDFSFFVFLVFFFLSVFLSNCWKHFRIFVIFFFCSFIFFCILYWFIQTPCRLVVVKILLNRHKNHWNSTNGNLGYRRLYFIFFIFFNQTKCFHGNCAVNFVSYIFVVIILFTRSIDVQTVPSFNTFFFLFENLLTRIWPLNEFEGFNIIFFFLNFWIWIIFGK